MVDYEQDKKQQDEPNLPGKLSWSGHRDQARLTEVHQHTTPVGGVNLQVPVPQVVGVMDDEMKAAQKWKGVGVLDLMAHAKEVGPYFITDTERKQSIFEIDGNLLAHVTQGIISDGSNLGHVTAVCLWMDINISLSVIAEPLDDLSCEDGEPESLEGVHLLFDAEAAEILPMVVRARLQKGKFFVFHNAENHTIHMIPPDCHEDGIYVNQSEPLKAQGSYLQMYCSHGLLERMAMELDCLQDQSQETPHYPQEFRFSDPTILITVSPRGQLIEQTSL